MPKPNKASQGILGVLCLFLVQCCFFATDCPGIQGRHWFIQLCPSGAGRNAARQRHWIPACAGMTGGRLPAAHWLRWQTGNSQGSC